MSDDITRAIIAAEKFADALSYVYDKQTLKHVPVTRAFQNRLKHYNIPLVLVTGEPLKKVEEP